METILVYWKNGKITSILVGLCKVVQPNYGGSWSSGGRKVTVSIYFPLDLGDMLLLTSKCDEITTKSKWLAW